MTALNILKQREGDIAKGKLPGVHFDHVSFDELAEDLLRDYRLNEKKSLDRTERSVRQLKPVFQGAKVTSISTARIKKYIEQRLEEGAANATVNRELAALRRMLNLGAQSTPPKVDRVPHIPMLKERNTRKGFIRKPVSH
jgi:site-specific recombinase XerD